MNIFIPQELASSGYSLYTDRLSLGPGLLNRIIPVINSQGDLFCLRLKKNRYRRPVNTYFNLLYKAMGLSAVGGEVVFRDMAGQVKFIADCKKASLDVPAVVAAGSDWMLTEYVSGVLLKDLLSTDFTPTTVINFLNGIFQAHAQDIVFIDRSGSNEIVSEQGRITFVDFDVKLQFRSGEAVQDAAAFDLAVAMRTCLLWPQDKKVALDCVLNWIQSTRSELFGLYNLTLLVSALKGSCRFYDLPPCKIGLALSSRLSQFRAANTVVYQLADYIEQLHWGPVQKHCDFHPSNEDERKIRANIGETSTN